MRPGAPVVHDKGPESRIANPQRNIAGEVHGDVGDVAAGSHEADAVYEGTYTTQRVQHAHLETHGAIGWLDERGASMSASSIADAVPGTRARLPPFDLDPARSACSASASAAASAASRRCWSRTSVALAALKTGRPVKLEFTREEQFVGATTRHPMRVRIKAGARRDGTLTAMQMHVVSNTGAYGNHGPAVLYHACGESFGVYRCANKKVDGFAVYTNIVPAGAFRGYGLPQTNFAVESAMDELARSSASTRSNFAPRNVVQPGDPMISTGDDDRPRRRISAATGSINASTLVKDALDRGGGLPPPPSDDWLVGKALRSA